MRQLSKLTIFSTDFTKIFANYFFSTGQILNNFNLQSTLYIDYRMSDAKSTASYTQLTASKFCIEFIPLIMHQQHCMTNDKFYLHHDRFLGTQQTIANRNETQSHE